MKVDKDAAERATAELQRALTMPNVMRLMEEAHQAECIVLVTPAGGLREAGEAPASVDGYRVDAISLDHTEGMRQVASLVTDELRDAFNAPHDADRMRVLYANGETSYALVLRLRRSVTS